MGKGIIKNDSRSNLPPLGRDPSKSKMENRFGSAMGQQFATNDIGSIGSLNRSKSRGYDS